MKRSDKFTEVAKRGFTLVELLVVVAILGVLGTIGLQGIQGHLENARKTAAKTAVDNIKGAVVSYNIAKKKMPSSLNDLIVPIGDNEPILEGGEGALVDPWDTDYKMEITGKRVVIISAGPDAQFGTDDDIRSDKIEKNKDK